MKIIMVLAILVMLALSTNAENADCYYNGHRYPKGTNINGVVCQPDGTWR